ncbi:MAG: FKBP-type peptidyl-prolyl cis-trans isomerase [Marinifilaceae bacterium]
MLAKILYASRLVLVALIMVGGVACSKSRLQRMKEDEKADRANYIKENNIPSSARTDSGLYYLEIEAGEGELPKNGDKLYVYYTGSFLDGTVFDSNQKNGRYEPLSFTYNEYGGSEVIQGWYEGLGKMKKGGKAKLIVPSSLAYGSNERTGIPAYSTLIFEVELVDIRRAEN